MPDEHSESISQETVWDLEINPITGLTNIKSLNNISQQRHLHLL